MKCCSWPWVCSNCGWHLAKVRTCSTVLVKKKKAKGMLFFYAFTGCDLVSALGNKEKKTVWQTWNIFPEVTPVYSKVSKYLPTINDNIKKHSWQCEWIQTWDVSWKAQTILKPSLQQNKTALWQPFCRPCLLKKGKYSSRNCGDIFNYLYHLVKYNFNKELCRFFIFRFTYSKCQKSLQLAAILRSDDYFLKFYVDIQRCYERIIACTKCHSSITYYFYFIFLFTIFSALI